MNNILEVYESTEGTQPGAPPAPTVAAAAIAAASTAGAAPAEPYVWAWQKPKRPQALLCVKCGKEGHAKSHCPTVQCYNCLAYGHIASMCPKGRSQEFRRKIAQWRERCNDGIPLAEAPRPAPEPAMSRARQWDRIRALNSLASGESIRIPQRENFDIRRAMGGITDPSPPRERSRDGSRERMRAMPRPGPRHPFPRHMLERSPPRRPLWRRRYRWDSPPRSHRSPRRERPPRKRYRSPDVEWMDNPRENGTAATGEPTHPASDVAPSRDSSPDVEWLDIPDDPAPQPVDYRLVCDSQDWANASILHQLFLAFTDAKNLCMKWRQRPRPPLQYVVVSDDEDEVSHAPVPCPSRCCSAVRRWRVSSPHSGPRNHNVVTSTAMSTASIVGCAYRLTISTISKIRLHIRFRPNVGS